MKKRIDTFVNVEKGSIVFEDEETPSALKLGISSIRNTLNHYMGSRISYKKEQHMDRKLLRAGNPMNMTVIDFQVLKLVLKFLFPAVFIAYAKLLNLSILGCIISGIIGLTAAIILPGFYLNLKIKQRHKLGLKELPDFLDLLTVCLEAGLGFDSALNKVISKRNGVLSSEFHICIEEIRLGKTRKEALTEIRERLDFDEMKSLINSILQAEKLGISIVQILRIKSQEEREKRRQRAEEAAMKAPIKILFPLVLFIFPSIFTVLLGPAVIQLMTQLGK
jgi:tight adherence protein C